MNWFVNDPRPKKVLKSGAGYYIGTTVNSPGEWDDGGPYARHSQEYYGTKEEAESALENNTFTQRQHP